MKKKIGLTRKQMDEANARFVAWVVKTYPDPKHTALRIKVTPKGTYVWAWRVK